MLSHSGSKTIIQTIFEMSDRSKTNELPSGADLWENTRKNKKGEWVLPSGEDIQEKLKTVAHARKDEISSAPIPLVKEFNYVFKRTKWGYAPGLGIGGMTKSYEEKITIEIELEATKKRVHFLECEVEDLKKKLKELTEKCGIQQVTPMQSIHIDEADPNPISDVVDGIMRGNYLVQPLVVHNHPCQLPSRTPRIVRDPP